MRRSISNTYVAHTRPSVSTSSFSLLLIDLISQKIGGWEKGSCENKQKRKQKQLGRAKRKSLLAAEVAVSDGKGEKFTYMQIPEENVGFFSKQ